jgi:hypothetical protein
MDAISPEFRYDGSIDDPGDSGFNDWRIDRQNVIMHTPTRLLFSIYLEPGAVAEKATLFQFRARLSHVCDGFPVPARLSAIASEAIFMFAYLSGCLGDSPDDIPF